MAKTATSKTSYQKSADLKTKIRDKYQEYILLKGMRPASVFQFMYDNKWKEAAFYEYYGSFDVLEKEIWADYFRRTQESLIVDPHYQKYSAREKMLAFYYTLIEVLKADRSFVYYCYKNYRRQELTPSFLIRFKELYLNFANEIVQNGKENEEILGRPLISDHYKDGLWLQFLFVLRFWLRDESAGFEKTDAAIEKAVNLSFELMGRGPLDQIIDFAKFLYHNRS